MTVCIALIIAVLALIAIVIIAAAPRHLPPLDPPPTPDGCSNGDPSCRTGARFGQCRGDNII